MVARMDSVNPIFIPRNHRIEQAIQDAVAGDLTVFKDLNLVLAQPFLEQPEYSKYAEAPEPNERVTQTFAVPDGCLWRYTRIEKLSGDIDSSECGRAPS